MEPHPEIHTGSHEIGPIREAIPGRHDPSRQVSAADALLGQWNTYFDLIPDTELSFLHGSDDRRSISFKQLKAFMVSSELAVPGLGREDRVCTALPNGPEAAVCFLAFALRWVYAPLQMGLTKDELRFELLDLPAKALVLPSDGWLREQDVGNVRAAINVAIEVEVEKLLELLPSKEFVGLFTLGRHTAGPSLGGCIPHDELATVRREDIALVLHTSGTTKKPKIVCLTHANIGSGALCIGSTVELQPMSVCNNGMPLFHIHGLIVNVLASAVAGSQLKCLPGSFTPHSFVTALSSKPQPTWYSAVPTMHLQVLELAREEAQERGDGFDAKTGLHLIRNCSAALVPKAAEELEEVFGAVVMPTYAMTESMPIASNPLHGRRKLRSVGPEAGPTMRIMAAYPATDFMELGKEGEVVVRGGPVTLGYELRDHMDSDPNVEAFGSEGWLRTGDKGWLDRDGYLYLNGRFKELVNRAGEKISPFEIEDALRGHESLQECIAFAAPHGGLGEVVGIAAVVKPGHVVSIRELRAWCLKHDRLQPKWVPQCLVRVPAIPQGPTGKPMRIGLAQKLGLPMLADRAMEFDHAGV